MAYRALYWLGTLLDSLAELVTWVCSLMQTQQLQRVLLVYVHSASATSHWVHMKNECFVVLLWMVHRTLELK